MQTECGIDRAKGSIYPLSVLVGVSSRVLELIVDISEDAAGSGSVGGRLVPLKRGGGKDVIVEGSDGVACSEGASEDCVIVCISKGEGVVSWITIHVGCVE